MLPAITAGSGTVTSVRVEGQQLKDRRVLDSRGEFPASIAVHGTVAYVMNAGGEGSVQGFKVPHEASTGRPRAILAHTGGHPVVA